MNKFKNEADALVARKALMMTRFAMGRLNAREFKAYQAVIKGIDKRMSELRALIEAE